MTAHLLLLTIGPVQDFIAQARRTRDLWHGSHLLSELGRAAARALVAGGAQLVFPALPAGHSELEKCSAPLRESGQPPLNIANRLLAEVPAGIDPELVARTTRDAVMAYWRVDVADVVRRERCPGLLPPDIDAVWDEQIATCIEFSATWAPLGDYVEARRAVDRALAARKHLRDFAAWRCMRGGVPKSSLDGARETVLRPPHLREARLVRKYRISDGEQLDAVGLVKRAGGDPDQFVPVVNVAVASWVAQAARVAPEPLASLRAACGRLKLPPVRRLPCAEPFPFDASILFPARWQSVFEELDPDRRASRGDVTRWGREHVGPLLGKRGEPHPYVACLVADGDHMGRAIERIASATAHRELSRALSGFASRAREIVEQQHLGSLVYSGGDDVLGFVPLPEALACAGALRRCFAQVMARACPGLAEGARPTLSVGLGVGHAMESMAELLALGREAEVYAKGSTLPEAERRNALAIIVDKRSGGRCEWRAQWSEWGGDPAGRLQADAALLVEQISTRKVYEIARTLRQLPDADASSDPAWARILVLEVRRSLGRTHSGERAIDPAAIGLVLDENAGYAAIHGQVSRWIHRMLVARAFAEADPRPPRLREAA